MKGFKKIYQYLKSYLVQEFHIGLFLFLGVFLTAAIWFNYTYNFERGILDKEYGKLSYLGWSILYYMVPYLVGCLGISIFRKDFSFYRKGGFWLVLFIFAFALSFDSYYKWYNLIDVPGEIYMYSRKMVSKLTRGSIYLIPLLIYFFFVRKRRDSFFGLTTKGFDRNPYLIMMLIMTPLLIWASFNPDFLRAYPTYNPGRAEAYLGVSNWVTFIPYELFYAFTFFALEILFRGFLIFEMEKFLGERVVIPMVCVYCTLHFGKPMMECVSSIFGGFILGVIALRTRSVYGGVWVHIFIAVGMDVLAHIQKEYFID